MHVQEFVRFFLITIVGSKLVAGYLQVIIEEMMMKRWR